MRRLITLKFTLEGRRRNHLSTQDLVDSLKDAIEDNNDGLTAKVKVISTTEPNFEADEDEDEDEDVEG